MRLQTDPFLEKNYEENPLQPRFSQEDAPSPSLPPYIEQVKVSNYLFIQRTFHSEMSIAQ